MIDVFSVESSAFTVCQWIVNGMRPRMVGLLFRGFFTFTCPFCLLLSLMTVRCVRTGAVGA